MCGISYLLSFSNLITCQLLMFLSVFLAYSMFISLDFFIYSMLLYMCFNIVTPEVTADIMATIADQKCSIGNISESDKSGN